MAEEKEGVTLFSSEQNHREMDCKKNYGRRKLPIDPLKESEEFFEVDKIVGMTKINGKERYKVRWVGYPSSNDTWEPRENLLPCIEMVEDFERDRQRLKKRRAEERRIRKQTLNDVAMMEGRLLPGGVLPDKLASSASNSSTTVSSTNVSTTAESQTASNTTEATAIANSNLFGQDHSTTLKDTFWKDLEEGKVDLFETDMYSKVKAQGRASRPKSFKNAFNKQSERLRGTNTSQSPKKSSSKGNRKQKILAKYYSQRRRTNNHLRKSSDKTHNSYGMKNEGSNVGNRKCDDRLNEGVTNVGNFSEQDWSYSDATSPAVMKSCDLNIMDCDKISSISYLKEEDCSDEYICQGTIAEQSSQGCHESPPSKENLSTNEQTDYDSSKELENDDHSKSQITCDASSQHCDCDNLSTPSSSPSSAVHHQNSKDPTHCLAKKRRTRLKPNRNIVISYSSKRKKTKFQNLRTPPKRTMRTTMNSLPPEKTSCNIFAVGESSVDSGVSSLRNETETEMDSNSPGLESVASTVSISRSMTPQDTGSVSLLEEDNVISEPCLFVSDLLTPMCSSSNNSNSNSQLLLPCDELNTDSKLSSTEDKYGSINNRYSSKIKACRSTTDVCPEGNSVSKQSLASSNASGYSLTDQTYGMYNNSKSSLGTSNRWEMSALLKLQNPLISIRNKIVRNFFDACTTEELTNFCCCYRRSERSRDYESAASTSTKKPRLSNGTVLHLSNDEFTQAVLAGDYGKLKSALRGDRWRYDLESPNSGGYTLIMQSILRGFSDITLLLALAGAQLDKELSTGETALTLACTRGEVEAVEVLVKLGANLEKYTTNKETALIKSVLSGNIHIVKLLLDHGANIGFQNKDNLNSLDLASKNPNLSDIESLLSSYSDKISSQMNQCIKNWLGEQNTLLEEVFPLQCMSLAKSRKIQISFRHIVKECTYYEGYLLFLVHVNDIAALQIGCRLKGESVVSQVWLNGILEKQVSLPSKFVMSFRNLRHGDNTLLIETYPDVRITLLICAYKIRMNTG
ncbi:uncharacterized protein LOC115210952 isoform X2 [Octopus sinensis]|uniref:Uncharacterized protein LOC115210952 isoform X2 n=1 Tax=Octopus sinensis TaxID=2607531 RepID=A0A7E6ET23_9MOLL|nr:uncharacterized protein LOC115210952 isoform X2 [Octopus sinensis]